MSAATTKSGRHKHRRPSAVGTAAKAATTTAGAAAVVGGMLTSTASSATAATADDFYRLRMCESGNNYSINTGNGYYGAYQFDERTWHGLGYGGLPSQASPGTQDRAAATLQSQRGWQPWPACSRRLGLGDTHASRGTTRHQLVALGGAPAFPGTVLTTGLESQRRADVYRWQAQMARRGWPIGVDGYFGPQSAGFAAAFANEKGVHDGLPGQVGANVWHAAWTAPIT